MDIIEELRQNRESGALRLVIEYKAGLMVVARRFYLNESDAEEAVNATFAKIIENINGFLEQSSLFTWMCQILVNEFRKSVRRKSNRMEILPDEMPEVEDDTACKAIYDNLDATLLRSAIDELPEDVRKVYELGGARYFDAMNVHPYGQPRAPEGLLDAKLESLRATMAEFGDADKPILVTEHGWPTHDTRAEGIPVLRAGLKIARPGQKTWRVAYAATSAAKGGQAGVGMPRAVADALEEALPPGSSVEACDGNRLRERLAADDVDLVVYPFDETYPVDTFADVRAFVERGGVLADLGGMPMWYPVRETGEGTFAMGGQEETSVNRAALRIGVSAWWMDPALLRETKAYPTEVAKEAGYRGDPAGESATRFLTTGALREGDEFIPILVAKDNAGRDAVAAAVTRFGDTGGCTILSGLYGRGQSETVDEITQARYLARSLAICFAEGVEQYYWYELRANENDPFYSENHFGLMHHNLTPKPAWGAYLNFTLARPAGSVQMPGPWHDEKREFFFPQWTRPDGANAGILWKTGCTEKHTLRFSGDRISFRDHTGRILKPARTPEGDYVVPISADPIYFEGGALVP